jgi:lysophospholipase L1-like esterase
MNFINLGFGGLAKGEPAMAEYISTLDMAALVYDYDFNAPSVEHYAATHEKLYRAVRAAHPELPILIVTAPVTSIIKRADRRRIAMQTYLNAAASGDTRVFYLDGASMMADDCSEDALIDGVHPSDLGIRRMAYSIGAAVDEIMRHFELYDR